MEHWTPAQRAWLYVGLILAAVLLGIFFGWAFGQMGVEPKGRLK